MVTARRIPEKLLELQRQASDPHVSAWVAANAGSGKTYVLAQRVIRLLLEGTDPAKILCLTFTKAAAANMANRVFETLRAWTALNDEALNAAIRSITGGRADPIRRERARRLFAAALETPGGLKVQTIHAFCTRLLHQFPFEANVAARFTVLDEASETQLLDQLTLGVLLEAAAKPESALGEALAIAVTVAADQTFRDVVTEAIRKREPITRWTQAAGGVKAAIAGLCGALGIAPDDSAAQVERDIVEGPHLPVAEWPAAAQVLGHGSANDATQARRLEAALAASGTTRVENYLAIFFTEGHPRSALATKAIKGIAPELCERLEQEKLRLQGLIERRRAVACRDRTLALLTIADAVIARYAAEKDRRALLDYDDLIEKTLTLLANTDVAWVHYKLDTGIDHVLVDEAQDTSARQWQIVAYLVAEFTAGEGARRINRSMFAVGDDKQSIFSFQGAAPHQFDEMRRRFAQKYYEAELEFVAPQLLYSFRSVSTVLAAVDHVFTQPAAYAGLTTDQAPTVHEAVRGDAPGLVELWPLTEPDPAPEIEPWDTPFDTASETSPRVKLARRIAANIRLWQARQDRVGDGDERHIIEPGDILILVRQRGPLFEAIIRALKNANIPVAGADRLVLTEHIAVMDLMVLADALLLPQDDLALATVLKSPLFGLDDADLFALAWKRERSLRAMLDEKRAEPRFAAAADKLARLTTLARHSTPFAFYAAVLGAERGRQQFLARLGEEASDALDEFLNLALDYERRETPSLQGFVAWLRTANAEVKRDMETDRNEVRVMTVHGAKGLEAPIVILADTCTPPAGPQQQQPRLLPLVEANAVPGAPERFVWIGRKADDGPALAQARERLTRAAEDEYRRLLYVAMTRAADRLVICGAAGLRQMPQGCWYELIRDALEPISVKEAADDREGEVWRFRRAAGAEQMELRMPAGRMMPAAPAWLAQAAPIDPASARHVAPSSADDDFAAQRSTTALGARKARMRGILVHRLMQSLPDIPAERRSEAARAFLERATSPDLALSPDERDALAQQVLRVLEDERFHHLFAPGSRAEVPIIGRITMQGQTVLVSGQVDRLCVRKDGIFIADYKTNRPAPRRLAEVPRGYPTQLGLYRAVLRKLYPERPVSAAIVWTEVPDLMAFSDIDLDAAVAGHLSVTSP
ncbi:MAG TPA: double-strand break repair helicase AddA [Pseudolabrys sp.]|nr:double-strand break repair helicase AddA [Pseudolabrys sp.]